MKAIPTIALIITFLSLCVALRNEWLLDRRSMNIFDARTDAFREGVQFARDEEDRNAKLGLCMYAAVSCGQTKRK